MKHKLHIALHATAEIIVLEKEEARLRTRKRKLFMVLAEAIEDLGANPKEAEDADRN